MSEVVQATCPGCNKVLRIPGGWVAESLRCKHCGLVVQVRRTAAPPPKAIPVALPVSPPPNIPVGIPVRSAAAAFCDTGKPPRAAATPPRRRAAPTWAVGAALGLGVLAVAAGVTVAFWPKLSALLVLPAAPPADPGQLPPDPIVMGPPTPEQTPPAKPREPAGPPTPAPAPTKPPDPPASTPAATGPAPRRALVVSVNNYLYANPVHFGMPVRSARNTQGLLTAFVNRLRVPADQVALLSDITIGGLEPRTPFKDVITQTVADFLASSRAQDRVMVFFIGHAVEIGDEAFLVPAEGELDVKEGLIPLAWVYQQLEQCKARQKVLVLDVCRLDPARGAERAGGGPMGEKFDALLRQPPPGVQVWSACVAGQHSYEFRHAEVNNGLFVEYLLDVLQSRVQPKDQRPDSPLPLAEMNKAVNDRMKIELDSLQKVQTARVTGEERADGAAPDPAEAAPPKPRLAAREPVGGAAARKLVLELFGDASMPPVKTAREEGPVNLDALPPFSAKTLEEYQADTNKAALREAVERARMLLWALSASGAPGKLDAAVRRFREEENLKELVLKDRYDAPANEEQFKNQVVLNDEKRVARVILRLTEAQEDLKRKEVMAEREQESSKRWQANYDYTLARLEAQLAYIYEYQSMLGQLRKELPPRDPKVHKGWQLASLRDPQGDTTGKKLAKSARDALAKLAREHAGTPWEVLAKRDRLTALGLEWQPTK